MARISEKHPRFRTKRQIAEDVAFILNAPVTYGTKFAVLHEACWVWTEFDGKYKGCRYWTKAAILARAVDKKAKLKHEHIVPKKVVINALLELPDKNADSVYAIMDRFLIGVVVTPEEDAVLSGAHSATMPPEFFDPTSPCFQDPWLRYSPYRAYGLEVILRCT